MSDKNKDCQYLIPGGMGWGLRSQENSQPKIVFQDKEQAVRYVQAKANGHTAKLVIMEKNGDIDQRAIAVKD